MRVGITFLLQVFIHVFVIWYGLWYELSFINWSTAAWISICWQMASPHIADIIIKRTRIGYLGPRGVVVITGAGRGLGKAAVISLIREGYHVIATVRDPAAGVKLKQAVSAPERLHPIEMDVASDDSVRAGIGKVQKILQQQSLPLVALINNAGIAAGGPVETMPLREYDRVNNINFTGTVRCIQAFLPLLRESISLSPRIINVSSVAGFATSPFQSIYNASKFAVEALSDCLRRELETHGIAVVVVQPAFVESDMPGALADSSMLSEVLAPVSARGLSYLYEAPMREFFGFAGHMYKQTMLPAHTFGDLVAHICNVGTADIHTRYLLGGVAANLMYRFLPDTVLDTFGAASLKFMGPKNTNTNTNTNTQPPSNKQA